MNPKKFINDFFNNVSEGIKKESNNRKLVECVTLSGFALGCIFFILLDWIFVNREISKIVGIIVLITVSYFFIRLILGKNMLMDVITERMEEKEKELKE